MTDALPKWAAGNSSNHFYIPPRYGRGNKWDSWSPICGCSEHISPWKPVELDRDLPCCENCKGIMTELGKPSSDELVEEK